MTLQKQRDGTIQRTGKPSVYPRENAETVAASIRIGRSLDRELADPSLRGC